MKVCVTGGGGFLGGAIARRLVEQGHCVRSFSRGDYPQLAELGIEQRRGDLADAGAVFAAFEECDIVYHVAAKAGIWGPYEDFYRSNYIGTRNVISGCKAAGISKLVYTSSPSVVFDGKDMEGTDESVPYPPDYNAFYPETKARAERLALRSNDSDLGVVALRPHLIWGPGDTHLVPGIIARGKTGRFRRVGNENKLVDFTYIKDAAEAHVLAGERLEPGSPISGQVYFISQGEPMPLWDFINRILLEAGLPEISSTISPRIAYVVGVVCESIYKTLSLKSDPPMTRFLAQELSTAHWFDLTAAKRDFGYSPSISMEGGFTKLGSWLRDIDPGKRN
jgi:nucleoside-diphosphate-sugar epimerase